MTLLRVKACSHDFEFLHRISRRHVSDARFSAFSVGRAVE